MPNTPNTSFIPKQGPVRRPRQTASRSVHLFSLISYITLASTMVASVGAFFYQKHIEGQLQDKVGELSQAIGSFSEADMDQVREFNIRLGQTRDRLDNSVSIRTVFEALEDATVQSVSLASLKLERFEDDHLEVAVKVDTDTFDSSLFQRGVFERSNIVESVNVEELQIVEEAEEEDGPVRSGVSFLAEIYVPIDEVPNIPSAISFTPEPVVIETVSTSTDTNSIPVADTEESIIETNEITP
jgi:hypothetical protein